MLWECEFQVAMQARPVRSGARVIVISEPNDVGAGAELLVHLLEEHKLLTLSHISSPSSAPYQSLTCTEK